VAAAASATAAALAEAAGQEVQRHNSVMLTGTLGQLQTNILAQEQVDAGNNAPKETLLNGITEENDRTAENSPIESPVKVAESSSADGGVTPKHEKTELSVISEGDAIASN